MFKFRIFGKDTKKSCIRDEIKSRLNVENVCSNSVQNILSSRLPYKNLKINYTKL